MSTRILELIEVKTIEKSTIEFNVNNNKIFVVSNTGDATSFAFSITKEDWNKIKKYIDSKLK